MWLVELETRFLGVLPERPWLMYFLKVAGEPLKLSYKACPYGSYAENLRHVLGNLESRYIHGLRLTRENDPYRTWERPHRRLLISESYRAGIICSGPFCATK
jgi:hypothetical protein